MSAPSSVEEQPVSSAAATSAAAAAADKNKNKEVDDEDYSDAMAELELLVQQLPGEELSSMLIALSVEADDGGHNKGDDDDTAGDELRQQQEEEESAAELRQAQERADAFFNAFGSASLLDAAEQFTKGEIEVVELESDTPTPVKKEEDGGVALVDNSNNNNPLRIDGDSDSPMRSGSGGDGDGEGSSYFNGFSRAYSDVGSDEDWVLEKICSSRRVPRSAVPAEELEDPEDAGAVSTRVTQYLCKWRFYSEMTWETGVTLAKLGFDDNLVRFEKQQQAALAAQQQQQQQQKGGGRKHPIINLDSALLRPRGYRRTVFESIFPDWEKYIVDSLNDHGCSCIAIANVAPSFQAAEWLKTFSAGRQTGGAPTRVWHGARAEVIPAICTNGLAVPGSRGCVVKNAQAYSRSRSAIYTSRTPSTATSYGSDLNIVFCCAALVGAYETSTTKEAVQANNRTPPKDWRLFYENQLLVPVWMCVYAFKHEAPEKLDSSSGHPLMFGDWVSLLEFAAQRQHRQVKTNESVVAHVPVDRREDVSLLKPAIQKENTDDMIKRELRRKLRRLVGSNKLDKLFGSKRMMKSLPRELERAVAAAK